MTDAAGGARRVCDGAPEGREDVARRLRRQRQERARWRARDAATHGVLEDGVDQDDVELRATPREPESDRPPQLTAHVLGEIERVLLVRRDGGERLENRAQVADAHALLDESTEHVGEQHQRDGLWDDVAHGRRRELLELVEQSLHLGEAEEVRGPARGAARESRRGLVSRRHRRRRRASSRSHASTTTWPAGSSKNETTT